MRLIDVDALTKRLVEFCNKSCPYTAKARNVMCGSCFMGLALEAVEDAPAIEPDLKWIPCSEKLPERGKDVLVTRHYLGEEDNNKSCYYVEVATRYGDDDNPDWISFSDEYKMHPKNHIVIAWQELPEPYKGEMNEKR